jgi:hypothetical protein
LEDYSNPEYSGGVIFFILRLMRDDFRDLSVHFIDKEENISHIEINFADKNTVLVKKIMIGIAVKKN